MNTCTVSTIMVAEYNGYYKIHLLLGRRSFEHRYMLASASPSAFNKLSDMSFPVQSMAFRHQ